MVYFIQQGEDGPIKIGISRNPKGRLRQLQTAHAVRLRILHTMPGGNDEEHALHRRFRHLHMHGEWFRPHQDLVTYIEALRRGHRPPIFTARAVFAVTVAAGLAAVMFFALALQLGGY